ncbi:MAG: hypothetical protein ACTSPD_10035 [Promethearchaeota archaeon]
MKEKTFKQLQKEAHQTAKEKGFWDSNRNDGEMIALMHSELSEALEELRHNNLSSTGEELADCIIRIMDFCEGRKINLENILLKKMKYNKTRPYKHGKKF